MYVYGGPQKSDALEFMRPFQSKHIHLGALSSEWFMFSPVYCSILALPFSLLATEQSRLVSAKHMVCLLHFLSSYSGFMLYLCWASLVAQLVKNLPAVQETWVRSLGWEDPLEKGKATHSSILAWRIPWTV